MLGHTGFVNFPCNLVNVWFTYFEVMLLGAYKLSTASYL